MPNRVEGHEANRQKGEAGSSPAFDFDNATEAERLAFDLGYEAGWAARLQPETMDLDDMREELGVVLAALDRMIAAGSS